MVQESAAVTTVMAVTLRDPVVRLALPVERTVPESVVVTTEMVEISQFPAERFKMLPVAAMAQESVAETVVTVALF